MKYIITSGPMQMKIDDVRKIENSSSGSLGVQFVHSLVEAGYEDIVYIHTKGALKPKFPVKMYEVDNHQEIIGALTQELTDDSVVIHAMAISDFAFGGSVDFNILANEIYQNIVNIKSPQEIKKIIENQVEVQNKLSSKSDQILLLNQEIKVIDQIKKINPHCQLIGFKLLSGVTYDELTSVARGVLNRANCRFVVANRKEDITQDGHKALIVDQNTSYTCESKREIAQKIIKFMERK